MGLCKCPKRKVTNLFCFEHRVNVCEHCLVSNHPNVSTYLSLLNSSTTHLLNYYYLMSHFVAVVTVTIKALLWCWLFSQINGNYEQSSVYQAYSRAYCFPYTTKLSSIVKRSFLSLQAGCYRFLQLTCVQLTKTRWQTVSVVII